MQLLQQLRSYQATDLSTIDEMVFLAVQADSLCAGYSMRGMEVPEWITAAKDNLNREIENRTREADLRALKEIEGQEESLKSASEKRQDLAKRRARLQEKLGLKPNVTTSSAATESAPHNGGMTFPSGA